MSTIRLKMTILKKSIKDLDKLKIMFFRQNKKKRQFKKFKYFFRKLEVATILL